MTIHHLSDTHSLYRRLNRLPDAYTLVHSGDFTMNGSAQEAIDFMNWFCDLHYPHTRFLSVVITMPAYTESKDGLDKNVHYLCNTKTILHFLPKTEQHTVLGVRGAYKKASKLCR